uniref:Small ribosomal subunit protein uS3c n=1 Tax=Tydemania expeditionis TaxID=325645 RepID=A0A0D6E2X2_TYDEX|nr:30S ribosomal protein S3 [Tydemania expeditionis]CEO91122.1 30S ribosomal protein S3 [Tydemania expeditionis]
MGQKVHPIGFRLGTSKNYLAQWFAEKKHYSKYLLEDYSLRKIISQDYSHTGIEKIEICRKTENYLLIKIYVEKIDILIGRRGEYLKNLHNSLKKSFQNQINNDKKLALYVLGSSPINASAVADFLIQLLEKRVPYRRAIQLLLEKKLNEKKLKKRKIQKPQGIKIQISGRLNGAEIARRYWIREGPVPLQTLIANIDYSCKKAQTIYGVLGIKVWIFVGF